MGNHSGLSSYHRGEGNGARWRKRPKDCYLDDLDQFPATKSRSHWGLKLSCVLMVGKVGVFQQTSATARASGTQERLGAHRPSRPVRHRAAFLPVIPTPFVSFCLLLLKTFA